MFIASAAAPESDVDLLEFPLNLEYLEAEFFLFGSLGHGLEAKRIDYCVDGCMLYYDNDVALTECKFCNKPRYCAKTIGTSNRKPVLVKAMFYLPITPRLQRLFHPYKLQGKCHGTMIIEELRACYIIHLMVKRGSTLIGHMQILLLIHKMCDSIYV